MKTIGLLFKIATLLSLVVPAIFSIAQEQSTAPVSSVPAATAAVDRQKVFVFVQRTDRHAKYSSAEVFHKAVDDVLAYLKGKNVAIAIDEFGGRNHAEGATPLDTIFTIAADAKASDVMYVVVDRPVTKWIKLTVQCFDMNRKQLWREEVSSGGGLSGGHGFEVATKKLHVQLDKHIGQEGLPVFSASQHERVAEEQ